MRVHSTKKTSGQPAVCGSCAAKANTDFPARTTISSASPTVGFAHTFSHVPARSGPNIPTAGGFEESVDQPAAAGPSPAPTGGTSSASDGCGTPRDMIALRSGAFRAGLGLSSYFPDLVGRGYWGSDTTAGPFDTGSRVGASTQLIGFVPSPCEPSQYRLAQTVTYVRTVRNGRHHPDEGKTMDDIAKSGRDASRPPFRQEFLDTDGAQGLAISMADPPSVVYGAGDNIEWDRSFVTSLIGPSGRRSVNWSTSIRVVSGSVTRNTIS